MMWLHIEALFQFQAPLSIWVICFNIYIYIICQSSCSSIYWEFTRYLSNLRDYSTHLRIREIRGKKKSGKKSNAPGGNFRNLCPHLRFSNILILHMGKSHIWFMSLVLLLYTPVCFLIHSFFFFNYFCLAPNFLLYPFPMCFSA